MYICLFLGAIAAIAGTLFRIQHWPIGAEMMWAAFAFTIVFLVSALVEVFSAKALTKKSRLMWGAALIPLVLISFIYYLPIFFLLIEWGYLKISKRRLYPQA